MRKLICTVLAAVSLCCLLIGLTACGKDKTPPTITVFEQPNGYLNEVYTIKLPTATDDKDGTLSVNVTVHAPSGKEVGVADGKFTPREEGEYRITFTAQDKAGNLAKRETTFTVTERLADAPVITVGDFALTAKQGDIYELPEVSAYDKSGSLDIVTMVFAPNEEQVSVTGGAFFVDYVGEYSVSFYATGVSGETVRKRIFFTASASEKVMAGVDGVLDEEFYVNAPSTVLGGMRGLESIAVKIARVQTGVYFGFDASEDKQVGSEERIELYFDSVGTGSTTSSTSSRMDLTLDGVLNLMKCNDKSSSWEDLSVNTLAYSSIPVGTVKLNSGTTLESGNTNDNGYTAEIFVPYSFIGINDGDSFYLTMGCKREGDISGWDGWNEFAVFPAPETPFKWVEIKANGLIFSDNRLYHGDKVDGVITDAKYTEEGVASTTVGGLRNLEGMKVKIARDKTGLYLAFDVSGDLKVNDHDRIEVYFNVGENKNVSNESHNLSVWAQSNGAMQVRRGNNGGWEEIIPYDALPQVATSYGEKTTPNFNDDEDDGYFVELYIPYSLFNKYTVETGVNENTRFGLTFGLWRASEAFNTTTDWSTDPNKDWDGWSFGEFCDPIYPETYAILLSDGRIVTAKEIVNQVGEPTDRSVDAVLSEAYWQEGAVLDIPKTDELDGVKTIVYRDAQGLRFAFIGNVKKITSRDVIVLYVSTKDSSHKIGGDLNDEYTVNGRYANIYDYSFRIWLDKSITIYRGQYKDWADEITDYSKISLQIEKNPSENSWIGEMFIPYSFFTAPDGFVPTADDTLGLSVRLGGENDRGSFLWNNYHYAGIYCDSESPASYVRIDKDNKLFAATSNNGGYRIDGVFDEAIYSQKSAELIFNGATASLYRGESGIHAKIDFATAQKVSFVISTFDHNLGAPYVYDYQVTVGKDGSVSASFGNSHGFYEPSLYVSYCAPRVIVNGNVAELFIPYEYLSRYNVGDSYAQKGWMEITNTIALKVAAAQFEGNNWTSAITYNGNAVTFDLQDPASYLALATKEA